MKRSISFENISWPISCPGAIFASTINPRVSGQSVNTSASMCLTVLSIVLGQPACFLGLFVICYFRWEAREICIWPVGQVRDSVEVARLSLGFLYDPTCSLQFTACSFFFLSYLYVYIFHCGLLFGRPGREKFIWFYFHFIWIVLWLLWLDFAPRFVCESWPISMRRLLLSCLLCWWLLVGCWWLLAWWWL